MVEIKEQRANLQARAPMGSGCGRRGQQDTAGVGRVSSMGRREGRQPIRKPVHICEPSGPKGGSAAPHPTAPHAQHASASGPLHLPSWPRTLFPRYPHSSFPRSPRACALRSHCQAGPPYKEHLSLLLTSHSTAPDWVDCVFQRCYANSPIPCILSADPGL